MPLLLGKGSPPTLVWAERILSLDQGQASYNGSNLAEVV